MISALSAENGIAEHVGPYFLDSRIGEIYCSVRYSMTMSTVYRFIKKIYLYIIYTYRAVIGFARPDASPRRQTLEKRAFEHQTAQTFQSSIQQINEQCEKQDTAQVPHYSAEVHGIALKDRCHFVAWNIFLVLHWVGEALLFPASQVGRDLSQQDFFRYWRQVNVHECQHKAFDTWTFCLHFQAAALCSQRGMESASMSNPQKDMKHVKTIENTKTHKFDWSRADSRQKTPVLQLHSEGDQRRTFGRAAPRSTCQHCKDGFIEFTVNDYSAILIFLYQCCECSVNHLSSFGANQLHPFQVHCVWWLI